MEILLISYISFVWDSTSADQNATAKRWLFLFRERSPEWRTVLDEPGLAVACYVASEFASIYRAHVLSNGAGVVLGQLFRKSRSDRSVVVDVLDEICSKEIVSSGGRVLVNDYWGQYVAFIRQTQTGVRWVFRDPSGEIDCFKTSSSGIHVYFNRVDDAAKLRELSFNVSRRGLIAKVALNSISSSATCLSEVTSLFAGEAEEHRKNRSLRAFYWDPLQIASTCTFSNIDEARDALREVTRGCVHAWSSCFNEIVLQLSGGLDSAIVLACLRDAPSHPQITCENLVGRTGSEQDERRYARLIAEYFQRSLVEHELLVDPPFRVPSVLPRTPDPYYFSDGCPRPREGGKSRHHQIDVRFTGHGGDEVFFSRGQLPTVTDYLYQNPLGSRAMRVAVEDAQIDSVPLWQVLKKGFSHGLLKRPWNYKAAFDRRMCRSEMIDVLVPASVRQEALDDSEVIHPFYRESVSGIPPGKVDHCAMMSFIGNMRGFPPITTPPLTSLEIDPLLSQPLIETCLRIPLYFLRAEARDRGLARQAFSCDLPAAVVYRRSKGGGNDAVRRGLARNIALVKSHLIDGQLVRQGYLDKLQVARALDLTTPTRLQANPLSILMQLYNEVWLKNWMALPRAVDAVA